MTVRTPRTSDDICVVELDGEIDVSAAPAVKTALFDLLRAGHLHLAIDFARVRYIDSAGLGVLVAALKRAREADGTIAIVCTNSQIRRIFEITGLAKVFEMVDDVEAARTALSSAASA